MGKYINTNDLELEVSHYLLCEKESEAITLEELKEITNRLPSADVVEVETLKKNIEANLDEARKLRDEHSSELIRAFQQGRMFGHECDLEMIKKEETDER